MLFYNEDMGINFLKGTHYIRRGEDHHIRSNPIIEQIPSGVVKSYNYDFSMMYIKITGLYSHFFMDGLAPVLEVFEKDKDCLFIIDFPQYGIFKPEELSYWLWTKELFDSIGLKYTLDVDSKFDMIEVKNCHVKNNYAFKKLSIDVLYKYAVQHTLSYSVEPTKKVYLSRKYTGSRIVNFREERDRTQLMYQDDFRVKPEELLESFLSDLGFEIVCPEDLTFEEQIKLMHETKILVGASQSGLINGIFMQPGQTMVELSTIMLVDNGQEYHDYWHSTAFGKMHNYVSIPHNREAQNIIDNINKNKYLLEMLSS